VNEELLSSRGLNGFMHSDDVYGLEIGGNQDYMDPNTFVSEVAVKVSDKVEKWRLLFMCYLKAEFDYRAQKSDELSFSRHEIITNVNKQVRKRP